MLLSSMGGRAFPIFAAFLALAVVWTWPLGLHLSSRIPHDPGDPILNTWLLWWNAHAIPFTERWWNPPIFYPMPGALALSEHLAGIGLISTPVQLLHANALFICSTNEAAATGRTRLRRVASSSRACNSGGSTSGSAIMSPGGISALPGLRN